MLKKKLKKISGIRHLAEILLLAVIAAQILNICISFTQEKISYHCDELYSYGLANSFYRPFIENEDIHSWDFEYVNEWFPGEKYHDYITVQEAQRFRYDSVWYNQSKDRHPPLYYAALHTICSFFPDTFSFWFGFILNLVCFAVTQFFLFRLARNILKSRYLALLFCCMWGLTPAAVNNTLFIRMYCMLTMWTVIFMYLHSGKYIREDRLNIRKMIPLAAVTALGALTQYLFLVVAFITACCFCIRFLIKKQIRNMLVYGMTVLTGVAVFFAVWPAAPGHLLSESGSGGALSEQFIFAVRYLFYDILCIKESTLVWLWVFVPPMLGIVIVLAVPLLFLFCDRIHIRQLPAKLKNSLKKFKIRKIPGLFCKCDVLLYSMILCVVFIVLMTADKIPFMNGYANRYFYIVDPFAAMLLYGLAAALVSRLRFKGVIVTALTGCLICNIMLNARIESYWDYTNDIRPDELLKDSNVLLVVKSRYKLRTLSTFAYELKTADNVFMTEYSAVPAKIKEIGDASDDKPLYIMMQIITSGDDEKGKYFKHQYFDAEKDSYSITTEYCGDYLKQYAQIADPGQYRYEGKYGFIEGDYLIYRLR